MKKVNGYIHILKKVYDRNVVNKYGLYLLLGVIFIILLTMYIYMYAHIDIYIYMILASMNKYIYTCPSKHTCTCTTFQDRFHDFRLQFSYLFICSEIIVFMIAICKKKKLLTFLSRFT